MKHLVVDGNAVLYRYFFGNIKDKIENIIPIAHLNLFYKTEEMYRKYDIDNIVITFDCKNDSWRKIYTSNKNPEKVTHRPYKGHRRQTLTKKEQEKMDEFNGSIDNCIDFLKANTSVLCLQENYLEGDDLIAGYIQAFPNDDHIIYSADKDFLQLINSIPGKVRLIESQKDTERSLKDWNNDPKLFLFEKCFRGEAKTNDNIQNAYPRLLRTKIFEAYEDGFKFNNILNHEFKVVDLDDNGNPIEYEYITSDLFNENKLLMGLDNQPKYIKKIIQHSISESIREIGKFDYIKFLKFCNNHGMERVIQEKTRFINMLSTKYQLSESS